MTRPAAGGRGSKSQKSSGGPSSKSVRWFVVEQVVQFVSFGTFSVALLVAASLGHGAVMFAMLACLATGLVVGFSFGLTNTRLHRRVDAIRRAHGNLRSALFGGRR